MNQILFFCILSSHLALILGNVFNPIDLSNLGEQINRQVQQQIAPLHNLGNIINQQVEEQLKPVRALELNQKIKNGIGGRTVLKFYPSGITMVAENGKKYICEGAIGERGVCNGNLKQFTPSKNSDFCYLTGNGVSIVNNKICLSSGSVSINVINNEVRCEAVNGQGYAILFDLNEFKRLCETEVREVEYEYYADERNPQHVPIPNSNPYVRCSNNEKNICKIKESFSLPYGNYRGSIIINNSF